MEVLFRRAVEGVIFDEESRRISGRAVVFNSMSRLLEGWFKEIIAPEAITEELVRSSDIVMTFNHDDNIVLARSYKGEGTLDLDLRPDGLYFSFIAPDTLYGNDVLYNVKSGNVFQCSFAAAYDPDKDVTWDRVDSVPVRTVRNIRGLYDCSICTRGAFENTFCRESDTLPLEKINKDEILNNMDDKEIQEVVEEVVEEVEEKAVEEETVEVIETEAVVEETVPETEESNTVVTNEATVENTENEEVINEEVNRNININLDNKSKKMEKRFSLINEIKRAYETGSQISFGELQQRAFTVNDEHDDVVETEIFSIVEPLMAKNVLVEAGANFITGAPMGDLQFPVLSSNSCSWAGETSEAADGSGSFTSVKLTPHRLTTIVPLSLEMLAQDTIGIENTVRKNIIDAVNTTLENTILGTSYAADAPQGLSYILADDAVQVSSFGDITNLEAAVESANVSGECKYVVNPKFKAAMRSTIKGTAGVGMIWENNEIDGTPALWTSNVPDKKGIYGKWSDLYIAQFGDITLDVVRDTQALRNGKVNLILNSFWDAKPVHEEAFALAYIQ